MLSEGKSVATGWQLLVLGRSWGVQVKGWVVGWGFCAFDTGMKGILQNLEEEKHRMIWPRVPSYGRARHVGNVLPLKQLFSKCSLFIDVLTGTAFILYTSLRRDPLWLSWNGTSETHQLYVFHSPGVQSIVAALFLFCKELLQVDPEFPYMK